MTDIIRPELMWIEGRCYRVNDSTAEVTTLQEHDLYEEEVTFNNIEEEGDDDDFEIDMIDSSRYCTAFHVSKHYLGSIIGRKGAIKSRIERDTKTEIKIPRQGQTGDIVILGPAASNVKAARRRINIIVISSRMKQKSTHFLSIPMNSPTIMKNYENFKENVLRECPDRGLEDTLFIKAFKLHLTLGVMCLMDNEERLHASKLLREARESIVMPLIQNYLPLKVRLKGLSYMNDDPREVDVLYGEVQEEGAPPGLLQSLADSLVDHFYRAGFMDRDHGRDNVKLHATLINSKYRRQSSTSVTEEGNSQSRQSRKPRETFDGSRVLEKFANYDFGVIEVEEIHLSQRHSMGPDGYYQSTCIISCKKS